ncbi:Rieske (2Fe-2S) protein [Pilimelia columellifera]|uniref:Rieske (2Fe-2S) protein n=1 Tax=Pilimelia columellifera subsp. columellifera TaxID=706583 RepID=A0ABN3N8L9_9ACTN
MVVEMPASGEGVGRRSVLLGVGAVGATVALAGCTGDGSDDGSGDAGNPGDQSATGAQPGGGSQSGGAAQPGGVGTDALAEASAIPVGGGVVVEGRQLVITQPTAGEYKGFAAECTHQGCPLKQIEGGTINCGCHGSKFSIEDGSVKAGPAKRALQERPVRKDGDSIVLA